MFKSREIASVENIKELAKDRAKNFYKMEKRLEELAYNKMLKVYKKDKNGISVALTNYLAKSKMRVDGYDKLAILVNVLYRLNENSDVFLEALVDAAYDLERVETIRDLVFYLDFE